MRFDPRFSKKPAISSLYEIAHERLLPDFRDENSNCLRTIRIKALPMAGPKRQHSSDSQQRGRDYLQEKPWQRRGDVGGVTRPRGKKIARTIKDDGRDNCTY